MKLKVVHLSTSDINGGAAIAAFRIHNAQLKSGINSKLLVQSKFSNNSNVISLIQSPLDKLKYYVRKFGDKLMYKTLSICDWDAFTFPYFGLDVSGNEIIKEADIIVLHQTNGGFLSLSSLSKLAALNKPLIFTLHDMWSFTGGCHYSNDCEKFLEHCGNCPSLKSNKENDFSRKIHNRKNIVYNKLNLNIVTCSNWLNTEAKRSSLFHEKRIRTIHNPVDTEIFKPAYKIKSRTELNLPNDKILILTGAMNLNIERKGFKYLISALKIISENQGDIDREINIVIFGTLEEKVLSEIPFQVHQLGKIDNENRLVQCYNSADIYVTSSLQDNLPNTVVESLSCGTPVVAFDTGGMPDMIEHLKNGYLAGLRYPEDFAKGIVSLLSDFELLDRMKINCRETALTKFNEAGIANQYSDFYKNILTENE
ncbi:D-inositol 3-phosphate glycosyltransferase [bacterium BMS3Abin03]|nr:D-inositol 3-phosphate glycosyltransferase [bacterium BMS3Abin03]